MKIIKDEFFKTNLQEVLRYISIDGKNRAVRFNKELYKRINNLSNMPYKFRKSYYYEDDNVRDFIFKGYTIPYLVDEVNSFIVLLDIFKYSHRDSRQNSSKTAHS
jgi:plasmid stabilization system protein ParE